MNACRRKRIEIGLTQQQVAEAVSITPQYYSYIEKGRRTPPTPLSLAIARFLNTTVEELFGGDDSGTSGAAEVA